MRFLKLILSIFLVSLLVVTSCKKDPTPGPGPGPGPTATTIDVIPAWNRIAGFYFWQSLHLGNIDITRLTSTQFGTVHLQVPTIDLTAAYRDANGNWKYEDLSGTVVLKSASWTTDPNLFTITVDVNNTVTGQVVPLTLEVFYYEAPADGINGSLYVKASFTGLNGNVVTEKFRLTELAPDAELVFATNHWGPGYRFILTSEFSPSIDYHFYSGFENVGTYGDISWRGCHVALGENYGFSTSGYYPMDFKTTTVVEIDPANPDLYTVYGTFVYSGSQGVIKYQNTLSQYVDHRQGILTFILNGVSTQYPVTSIGY